MTKQTEEQRKKLIKFTHLLKKLENVPISCESGADYFQELLDMYVLELKRKTNRKDGLVEGILVAELESSIDKLLSEMEVNKNEVMPVIESALKRVIERLN